MSSYRDQIQTMSFETYKCLQQSVELGRWPDGKPMSAQQRQNAMQAIIAWGQVHLPQDERVGYIDKSKKEGEHCDEPEETPLTWKE